MEVMESAQTCAVCSQEAPHRCSGCQAVYYCSKEHQRKDWKQHKATCRAFRVERSPNVGRRLIALRDLKPGDVIIQEKPLVMGPKQLSGPVCLCCYCDVDGKTVCSDCGWPVCGKSSCFANEDGCGSAHKVAECALMAGHTATIPVHRGVASPAYQSVMILRCLALKAKEPARWEELMQLESHVAERRQNGMEDHDRATAVRFIQQTLGLSVPEDLILQLCGILMVNSFELPIINSRQSQGLQAVYATASLIEHDCVANATKTFSNNGDIIIRATVPITKGERIALCYSEPMWGTINRQRHLSQSKFFQCRCDRCKDPTELETYASGILCRSCKQGVLLSVDPLNEESDWVCNQCGQGKESSSYVMSLIESIGKELIALKRGSVVDCEKFLLKHSTVLHAHHFYLTDVKMALCQMLGHIEEQNLLEMTDAELSKKEALSLELIKIADVISPGMNRLRGILLYELQAVVSVRVRKMCLDREISKEELQANVKMVRKILQEASTVFSWEPEETDEGRLAIIASKELKDVELFLKSLE